MADSSTKKRINQLIREAQRAGDVVRARELVQQALDLDPSSEKANLWMATLSDDKDQREHYIQRVLEINPRNRIAPYLRRVRTPEERTGSTENQETEPQESSNRMFSRSLLFIAAFSLIFMGILVFNRFQQYQADTRLAKEGNQALATITDKTVFEDEEGTYYRLWFTFDAQYKNETVTFSDVYSEVHEAVYEVVQIGDEYEITYMPDDPTEAQLSKLANPPALQEQFTRELVLYAIIATLPLDIGIIIWILGKKKKKDQADF